MKQRRLLAILLDCGAVFVRQGGEHAIYRNPRTGTVLSVPRHTEVSEHLARRLIKDACA